MPLENYQEGRKVKKLKRTFVGRRNSSDDGWYQFGDWLNSLFAEGGLLEVRPINCRHDELRPVGIKPCATSGTGESKKTPGMKYTTLRDSARRFVSSGRGLGRQQTLSRFFGAIDRGSSSLGLGTPLVTTEHSSISDDAGDTRSTKMRVAHLAILKAAFGDSRDVGRLKQAYARLKSRDYMVLHNCGCGLQKKDGRGSVVHSGCCEPSHLRFGKREDNDVDKQFHAVLNAPLRDGIADAEQSSTYFSLIEVYRKKVGGGFVF